MTKARRDIVSLADTLYYHCIGRCVRRAFLCGKDPFSGKDYEHRRGWIVERLKTLGAIFSIDVAAYAVMSNHYHVVLRVDKEGAERLSRDQVIGRWTSLFSGPDLVRRYMAGEELVGEQQRKLEEIIDEWRQRLSDISWFMRCLNEYIARLANAEDGVKGRFWEGRFKSQPLLDEQAVLTCMAYVDMNPVRANMAATPEESEFTSIYERILQVRGKAAPDYSASVREAEKVLAGNREETAESAPDKASLLDFTDTYNSTGIPFSLLDYLDLVDWTGRHVRMDKRDAIDDDIPAILTRLQIEPEKFVRYMRHESGRFVDVVGTSEKLKEFATKTGCRFIKGIGMARQLFGGGETAQAGLPEMVW